MADSKQGSGEVEGALASGGESRGGKHSTTDKGGKPSFSGGQTDKGYHGTGQLGDKEVGEGNPNAPAKSASSDKQ